MVSYVSRYWFSFPKLALTEDECNACRESRGLRFLHAPSDCPFEILMDTQQHVPFFHCNLCMHGMDCPIHECPLCTARHFRSECPCPVTSHGFLFDLYVERVLHSQRVEAMTPEELEESAATEAAQRGEDYPEESEDDEDPEGEGLLSALRRLEPWSP
jgi:hypothetical protein